MRRRNVALVLVMSMCMSTVGMSSIITWADDAKPFEGQEINFIDTGGGVWDEKLQPIIDKFEEETGATVNVELYSHSDYIEMLQIKLEAGTDDYDVIGVDAPLVASYASKGWVIPVDDYFTDDEKAEILPSALNAGSWQDVFYCPPMNSSSQLLWYNTALLDEAGVEVPESDTENRLTWEQVEQMAKDTLVKVDPDGDKGIAGITFEQVSRTYQMNEIPNSMGGKNIGDDGYTAEGIINSDEWIKACEWYQNLFNEGVALKGITADDASNYFLSGKIIFIVAGTWTYNNCETEGMDDFAYCPVPAFEGYEDKVATPTGSWHFGIPINAKNKDLAAEFIKYMSIGEGNNAWLEVNGDVPSTVAGVDELMNSEDAEQYMKIAAYESANTAVPRAITPGYQEYDTIVQNTWEDIKNGSDVTESLNSAASKIEDAMAAYK